jgi:hypothetical protein
LRTRARRRGAAINRTGPARGGTRAGRARARVGRARRSAVRRWIGRRGRVQAATGVFVRRARARTGARASVSGTCGRRRCSGRSVSRGRRRRSAAARRRAVDARTRTTGAGSGGGRLIPARRTRARVRVRVRSGGRTRLSGGRLIDCHGCRGRRRRSGGFGASSVGRSRATCAATESQPGQYQGEQHCVFHRRIELLSD